MRYLSNILALTIIIILLFDPFGSNAFEFQQNELSKAIQMFDKKQYAEAETLFEKLLINQPDDFMVNYFYGACRTENGHFSDRDLFYLEKASKEVSPLDIDYYFGMQYHAKEEWEKALFHYSIFSKTADDAELERVKLTEKIEQCENQVNPFIWISDNNLSENNTTNTKRIDSISNDEIVFLNDSLEDNSFNNENLAPLVEKDSNIYENTQETETVLIENTVLEKSINFSVNSEIIYNKLSNFKTPDGKQFFEQGNREQKELDTVLQTTKRLRDLYVSAVTRSEKDSLGQKILGLEDRSYVLKSEINDLFSNAKQAENEYWNTASDDEKTTFIALLNKPVNQERTTTFIQDDTAIMEIPEILIDNTSPQPKAAEPANKDLSYKIQIGAYSRGLPNSVKQLFDKLSLIRKIENYTDDRGVVVYTTGNLMRFEDAMTMLKQVQQEGVEDAIIAAYFKGKRIPLTEAKDFEGIK